MSKKSLLAAMALAFTFNAAIATADGNYDEESIREMSPPIEGHGDNPPPPEDRKEGHKHDKAEHAFEDSGEQ